MQSKIVLLGLAVILAFATGCGDEGEHIAQETTGGDVHRGAAAIEHYGCGSCHIIPGISGAFGRTGPPLSGIGSRVYVAGVLQNTPLEHDALDPRSERLDEKTVMPNLGVTPQDARDIAGYLYTLQ